MIDERDLQKLCQYIVSAGKKQKVDAIEVLARSTSNLEADVEMGEVNQVSKVIDVEISLRLFMDKKMGCSFTNIPTKEAADRAVKMAVSAARVTTRDDSWVGLPAAGSPYHAIAGLWDDTVPNADPGSFVDSVSRMAAKGIEAEAGLVPGQAGAGAASSIVSYANSNGIAHSERRTTAFAYLSAVAKIESGMTPYVFSVDVQRGLNLDYDGIVKDVADTIHLCKTTAEGETGNHTVIMHPRAFSQLLDNTFVLSVRGDNVARGKSRIGDKIGARIAADCLSIYDDGINPKGISTSVADDEGVPRQRTPIIEKGVLKSFLWDTYWANRMGVKSTGNAERDARRGLLEIGKTTVLVPPGRRKVEDILSGIKHGYYVRDVQGAHSSNPESGDFSVVGNPALLISDGRLVGAVHGLMVTGNIYELLEKTQEVARDPLFLPGMISPDVVFHDVSVVARSE